MAKRRHGGQAVAEAPAKHWRFTAQELLRMVETGILMENARVELLDGELYEMPGIGDWHITSVDILTDILVGALRGKAIVRVQSSFHLSPVSEPQPDVLLLRYRPDFYRTGGAGPGDVLLAIEVADSSTAYDRGRKLPLYARGGVPEVWIVVRSAARFEVYREPEGDGYRSVTFVERDGAIAPAAFPDLSIRVQDVIG